MVFLETRETSHPMVQEMWDTPDRKRHDWFKQAEAPNANTPTQSGVKSYNGTSNVGPTSSTEEDDTRRGAYSGAQLRNMKGAYSDVSNTGQNATKDETQYRKSSVMKDNTQSGVYGDCETGSCQQ